MSVFLSELGLSSRACLVVSSFSCKNVFHIAVCSRSVFLSELGLSSRACVVVSRFSCSLVLLLVCAMSVFLSELGLLSHAFHICVLVRIRLVISRVFCSLSLLCSMSVFMSELGWSSRACLVVSSLSWVWCFSCLVKLAFGQLHFQ